MTCTLLIFWIWNSTFLNCKPLSIVLSLSSTPPPTNATPTPNPDVSVPLYKNCTIRLEDSCTTDPLTSADGTQSYEYCATTSQHLAVDVSFYITDVFCSIDNIQIKPVTSSLRYNNGEWSCICQGIEIPFKLRPT